MRRLFLALSTFTFAALVLAGCGGDAVATTTPAATAATGGTVAATRAATTGATTGAATPAAASSATTGAAATTAPITPATTAATAAVTQAAAAAPAMGGTIRIGMIASLTGPYNPLGTANKQAADLVTKQVNDAGGINGAKIELMIEDDKSDPSQGPIALKKLLSNKIVALIGPVFSSTCLALYDDEDAAKIPTINQCATDANVTPSIRPYIFMTPPTATVQAKQVVAFLKSQGKTKVTVMHDTTDYGNTGWNALKTEAPKSGITVDEQLYELTGTTFVPQLTKIKNSDTQALVSWGSGGAAVIITKEFKQLGLTIPLVFSAAQSTPALHETGGRRRERRLCRLRSRPRRQEPAGRQPLEADHRQVRRGLHGGIQQRAAGVCLQYLQRDEHALQHDSQGRHRFPEDPRRSGKDHVRRRGWHVPLLRHRPCRSRPR